MRDSEPHVLQFPVISGGKATTSLDQMLSALRLQADSVDDTAARCTDPVIASELQYIATHLRETAAEIEGSEMRLLVK